MDKLAEHAIRMLEIVEGENDFFRNDEKRQADIARAVYDIILRVQMLEQINHKAEQTEPSDSEKPNNCKDWQDWKDRMWAEAIVTEPQIECKDCKYEWWNSEAKRYECSIGKCQYNEPNDEPQTEREGE